MTRKFHYSEDSVLKILSHVTSEWQVAGDISGWSELGISCTRACLNELVRRGKIENMWDGTLGVRYFKVTT